jgi:hypothetical protein
MTPRKLAGGALKGGEKMRKLSRFLLCLVLGGLTVSWAIAQDRDTDSKSKSDVRTITGCLTKGDSSNEFLLTGDDGSTWEIHNSASVNLASHVGQTVTATGTVSNVKMHNLKEDTKDAAHDTGMKKNNTEHGHLKVTDVQTVSESCQR